MTGYSSLTTVLTDYRYIHYVTQRDRNNDSETVFHTRWIRRLDSLTNMRDRMVNMRAALHGAYMHQPSVQTECAATSATHSQL
jgi:hypothetical protein